MAMPIVEKDFKLHDLKQNVEHANKYFKENYARFYNFHQFIYDTALTSDDIETLKVLQKPPLEFNVLEAFINRLCGEFDTHSPSVRVSASDCISHDEYNENLIQTIEVLEAHFRYILEDEQYGAWKKRVYRDTISGGFSVAEVYTDYLNPMSFEQKICVERVFDPTLCGFDPMARLPHKGDGNFAFKIVPLTAEAFAQQYGEEMLRGISFQRDLDGFHWTYLNQDVEIILCCEYYSKVIKKRKLVKLSNGKVIVKRHYEDLAQIWIDTGIIEQMPVIVEERDSNIEDIEQSIFCENKMIQENKTVFNHLPLVFFDGNSVFIRKERGNATYQMCRPYVYHAKGMQKLRNFAGQTLAAEIENMVMHKWKASIESIPEKYMSGYINPQKAQTLIYHGFDPDHPERKLDPPQEVQRTPTPPIVENTFAVSDRTIQGILGSFDAEMGISGGDTSGQAIKQGALHSSAAATPYLSSFMDGLNRVAEIVLDLIPKFYVTPRSLPIKKPNGMQDYALINDERVEKPLFFAYDPQSLHIKVEAGVNNSVQKQMALEQITRMMAASEIFGQFINQEGLEILVDNLDIRGIEQLKKMAGDFMQKMKEAQSQPQKDPMQEMLQMQVGIEQAKIQQKEKETSDKNAIKAAELALQKDKLSIELIRALEEMGMGRSEHARAKEQIDAENARHAVDTLMQLASLEHEKSMFNEQQKQLSEGGQ